MSVVENGKGPKKGDDERAVTGIRQRSAGLSVRKNAFAGLALLGTLSLAGCGGGAEDKILITPPDGAVAEAGMQDSGSQADAGVGIDAGQVSKDGGQVRLDAGRPPRLDSGVRVDSGHVAQDSGSSQDANAQADGGWQVCQVQSGYFNFTGYIASGTPQVVGNYSYQYAGKDANGNALITMVCGTNAPKTLTCPIGQNTYETDATNHRKVTLKPIAGSGIVLNVKITEEPSP